MTVAGGVSEQTVQEATNILAALTGLPEESVTVTNSAALGDNGAMVVTAQDGDNVINIIVADDTPIVGASINNGLFETLVSADAGINIQSTAVAVTAANGADVLANLISASAADAAAAAAAAAAMAAYITDSSTIQSTYFGAAVEGVTPGAVTLDFSNGTGANVIQALDFTDSAVGTVSLNGAAGALIVGNGSVNILGDIGATVIGDSGDQIITGGLGADTLIGGAGEDTIFGGEQDTFGFGEEIGQTTLELGAIDVPFADADITFDFSSSGFTDIATLNASITQVLGMETWGTAAESTTYVFADGRTVTLIGVTADEVTAEMVNFVG